MIDKKYLSIEDIEQFSDIRVDEVEVWGGTLCLGSLNAEDMIEFIEANEGPAKKTAGIRLIVKSLIDNPTDRNRIGSDKHLSMLKQKDSFTVGMVVKRIMLLNGIGTDAKTVEDLKNALGEATIGASPTVLH
jgi:hypothetical protein